MAQNEQFKEVEGTLVYVQIDKPVKAFHKPGTDPKPDEFKASIAVTDEDWVDEFEAWCATVDAKPSIKKVKAAEFEGIYKCPAPDDAGKNVWVLTFRKSSEMGKTGRPILPQHEPKAYEVVGGTLKDITHTKLIANGSKGVLGIEQWERTNGSMQLSLAEVVVLDLIEYVKGEREEVDVSDKYSKYLKGAAKEETKEAPKKATPAKTAAKAKPLVEDDDDLIPF